MEPLKELLQKEDDAKSIYTLVDKALYCAKQKERNQVYFNSH